MEFSVSLAIIAGEATVLLWLIQAMASFKEKTFSRRQGRNLMSFLQDWSFNLAGLFIFFTINGLIVGSANIQGRHCLIKYTGCSVFGLVASYVIHQMRWMKDRNHPNYIFPSREDSGGEPVRWMSDFSTAGWVRFLYIILQATILGWYVLSRMPPEVVILVGVLFSLFVVLRAFALPGVNRKRVVIEIAIVIAITIVKLR